MHARCALPNQFRCQTSKLFPVSGIASPEAVETCSSLPKEQQTCFVIEARQNTAQDVNQEAENEDLVELTGIEPVTPCLQSRCSPS